MIETLLYVSRSLVSPTDEAAQIDALVSVARSRNEALDVSGALLFTGKHFAQVLEGTGAALDELMASIGRDPRHSDVKIIEHQQSLERRFALWTMAYSGPSIYVDRHIQPLLADAFEGNARKSFVDRLVHLMAEFATPTTAQ